MTVDVSVQMRFLRMCWHADVDEHKEKTNLQCSDVLRVDALM